MLKRKTLNLRDFYFTNFALEDIFAMRQIWKKGVLFERFKPRPRTGIIFLNNCTGVYTDKTGESFTAPRKSIVCLPYASEYTCLNLECESNLNDAIQVEFNAIENDSILTFSDKPFIIKDVNVPIAADLFENVVQAYEASVPSALAIKTSVYNLILHICKEKVRKYDKRFSPISTGIELIESDTLCNISIEEIAKACNVSSCHFRRLFKEYSGKSPMEYRMDLRLNIARKMLESGETTLEYIVEALNFESTSYFCRVFKKKLGVTPSQYKSGIMPDSITLK
ncbi:MAG: helix-turn-helix transcriptional regulator [Clostridia bacterium]|nr:helix-turn-helix transcriptional regulator [Clostridia bacterium]